MRNRLRMPGRNPAASRRGIVRTTWWVAFIVVPVLVAGCQKARVKDSRAPLGVEQLAKAPSEFVTHSFKVRGVVSSVVARKGAFTLIDVEEYKSCRELDCAAYQVPVAFAGTLPDTAQIVLVTGRLEQPEPGHYLVRAVQVEREP